MTKIVPLLAVLLTATVAAADPDARTTAKAHNAAGAAYYQAQRYDEAIAAYQAAYDLAPHPQLLFNMAQAYRMKGDYRQAVELYRKYIAAEPASQASIEAAQHIDELNATLAAGAPQPRVLFGTPVVRAESPPGRGRKLKVAGLAVAGVGVLALGGAVWFGLEARRIDEEVSSAPTWTPEVERLVTVDGPAAARNALICGSVAAVAVVGGGVLYILGARASRGETVVGVAPRSDGFSLAVTGRF